MLSFIRKQFRQGDLVVYRKSKSSLHPGPRARDVRPAANGDNYSYIVDKFWVVEKALEDGTLLLKTRGDKTHEISTNDPNLRHASFWERIRYADRFPSLDQREAASA